MSNIVWTWTTERSIPSAATSGTELISELLDRLRQNQWGEEDVFGVHLALEEAVMNAIKHGNRNDHTKEVHIKCKASPSCFWVEITDEGEGFDPGDVPDPTDDENLEKPSGRGLMLMTSFMSMVEFNGQGNSVVMQKLRQAAEIDD